MRRIFFAFIFCFAAPCSFAQQILSLQQAIEEGLKNNYSILIFKNQEQQAANNVTAGNAGALPRVDLNVSDTRSINDTKQKYATGQEVNRNDATSSSLFASAALNWTIFDGFKMFAAYGRLKELQKMGELNARAAIENTISQIITGYYDIVQQKALLSVTDSALKISELKRDIAKIKFEIGSSGKVEYLQAQVDLNADISAYKRQQMSIDNAKVRLNQLMARDASVEFDVIDSIEINYHPALQSISDELESKNTSLLLAKNDISIANYYLREIEASRFPSIGLTGSYGYSKSNSQASFVLQNRTQGFNYGFTVTWNLFNGLTLNTAIKNARLDVMNKSIGYKSVMSGVNASALIAYRNFQKEMELLNLEEANGKLAKENLDLALERFRIGVINSLQLKDAQQTNTLAQNRLVTARYALKITETNLKLLTGSLIK